MSQEDPRECDVRDFLVEYNKATFPQEFLAKYEPIECLSQSELGETLLVKNLRTGKLCVCKCFDKEQYPDENEALKKMSCQGIPVFLESFEIGGRIYNIREYVEGESLQKLVERENMDERQAISVGEQLCDILACLHGQTPPVIHRDIKPSNVIVHDGKVSLIDFGISRTFDEAADTDTICLGTREYAPPEQYGFSQTDSRTDIYSLGVLLRFILTGSTKPSVIHHKRLDCIVKKCTSLAPENRYASAQAVKKDLLQARPEVQKRRKIQMTILASVLVILAAVGIYKGVQYSNRNIWPVDTPAYISSTEQTSQSAQYMNEKYDTDLFRESDDIAGVGYLRDLLAQVFGFDAEYVNALPPDGAIPAESDEYFMPWGFGADDSIHRDILTYVVVKTYWPEVVADWSSLKDDTGQYPGVRVANEFAEKYKLLEGMNRWDHITAGDVAIVYANAQRTYETIK